MARIADNFGRASWFVDANSLLVSAVCHLVGLIGLGLVTLAIDQGHDRVLLATIADAPIEPSPDASWLDQEVTLETAGNGASEALGPVKLFDFSSLATSDFAPIEAPAEVSTDVSGLDGSGLGKLGDKAGRLPGTSEFFGVSGYGQSFVYVVDCSGSMGEDGKFLRAREELMYSIDSLEPDQKYYVIFYSDTAFPMDSAWPIAATAEHIDETREWVYYVDPQGGTNPLPALLIALSLKPDAVYFLSDGKFNSAAIAQLRAKNRPRKGHRIPIHSIAFVNHETERLMRTIANGSGGEYRFVK